MLFDGLWKQTIFGRIYDIHAIVCYCVLFPVLHKAFQTFWQFLNFLHRFVPEFNGGFARRSLCSSAELGRYSGCRAP